MKRIYEFITKANQVMLFLLILGVAAMLAFALYQELTRRPYTPPRVAIAQTPEAVQSITVQDVRWLGNVSGVNFFGIVKKAVAANSGEDGAKFKVGATFSSIASESSRYGDDGQTVNIVISAKSTPPVNLLPTDGLVLSWRLALNDYVKHRASTFLCVTEDTDGNHVLDGNDRNDLYIVSMDASKPVSVITGIIRYDIISETKILIKTREPDGVHFSQLDIETLEKQEVRWK